MRYAVCHITPFFNPDICFSYCSPTCSQEQRKMLWASNEQTGGLVLYLHFKWIYPPDKTCIWLPKRTTAALWRRCGLFARCFFFLRDSQCKSLRLENRSQQSDTRACSHLRCSSAAGPRGIRAKQQPAFTRLHYWSTCYFNKLSPFLIVSSLFMCSVIQHSFAGKRRDLSIPPSK